MPKYINVDFLLFSFKELTYFDILLYSHIRNYTNHKPKIIFDKSQSSIAYDFNVSVITVKRSISNLKKYGFIRCNHIKSYKGDPQRLIISSVEPNQTKLYKNLYGNDYSKLVDSDVAQETNKVISELRQKWSK